MPTVLRIRIACAIYHWPPSIDKFHAFITPLPTFCARSLDLQETYDTQVRYDTIRRDSVLQAHIQPRLAAVTRIRVYVRERTEFCTQTKLYGKNNFIQVFKNFTDLRIIILLDYQINYIGIQIDWWNMKTCYSIAHAWISYLIILTVQQNYF